MCGIVVVAGKIGKEQKEVFRQMLIADVLRGPHSTGFFSAKGNGSEVFKLATDPLTLMEHKGFDRLLNKDTNLLVGHNRHATVGKVNRQNAHPFDFPNVVGVHNGTLTNKYQLPDHTQFDVDSEALYNGFDTIGAEETIAKARGAWSLVWWDKRNQSLNFLRNNERPMAYCLSEDGKTLYAASEGLMLLWILGRNGIKHTQITGTSVNTHYCLPLKTETEFQATALGVPTEKQVVGAPAEVFTYGRVSGAANGASKTLAYSFLNTQVTFVPDTAYTLDGSRYVEGTFWHGDEEFKVLVDATSDKKLEDFLLSTDPAVGYLTYDAVPQGIRSLNGEQFLVLRNNSIKGNERLKGKASTSRIEPMWPGYKGKALTMVQWRDLTASGCSCCGHIPTEEEKNTLQWDNHTEFLCDRCVKDFDMLVAI